MNCQIPAEVFAKAVKQFPELGGRLEFPLCLPRSSSSFDWILYGQKNYPKCFYEMADPPLILTVLGSPCWAQEACLSIVGSREPSAESLQWMDQEVGAFLEQKKIIIVSGGARGVDQAAHSLAVRKGVPTVVILPSGLSEIYPSLLKSWIPRIVDQGGCLISEYPLNQRVEKYLFHHRNRLIAQMGLATLVVQASDKSGSIMTGHLAAEAGRPLWVVPAHPLRTGFRGNLSLLREGAAMVCDAQDMSSLFEVEEIALNNKAAYLAQRFHMPTIPSGDL